MISLLLSVMILKSILGGHEVMHNFTPQHDDISAKDLAIIQFDTRSLSDYWNISVHWNSEYAHKHGHQFAFLTMDGKCMYATFELSPVWCKVKAMVAAAQLLPSAKAFVYLDTDAVVTANYSLTDIIGYMRVHLKWDLKKMPVAFNQVNSHHKIHFASLKYIAYLRR